MNNFKEIMSLIEKARIKAQHATKQSERDFYIGLISLLLDKLR